MTADLTRTATHHGESLQTEAWPGLVIIHHPDPRFVGSAFVFDKGQRLPLGRREDAFVPGALDDARISRRHAEVVRRRDALTLHDLESRNGSFVNGRQVSGETMLENGDVLGIGKLLLLVTPLTATHSPKTHPRLVGTSEKLHDALDLIDQLAGRDAPVLVLGESGVGKELMAREVHIRSGRRGELVFVNCAAIADGVVQSELFGHVRGAFSGAERARTGLVEQARGGTLVLDEIGDASPLFQANLLRLLQEKEVRAVGAERTSPVDVRFVASTNRPLADDVRAGRFREDLYGRLNRGVVRMPPLRERPEDILPLARHFAEHFAGRTMRLSQGLSLRLVRHDWPGNVRSLQGVMDRLIMEQSVLADLGVPLWLDEELAQHARQAPEPRSSIQAAASPSSKQFSALAAPLELPNATAPAATPLHDGIRRRLQLSADELRVLLGRHAGNISAMAEELGVGRNTLYRWVKKQGIDLDDLRKE